MSDDGTEQPARPQRPSWFDDELDDPNSYEEETP